jgi:hypothetical protein
MQPTIIDKELLSTTLLEYIWNKEKVDVQEKPDGSLGSFGMKVSHGGTPRCRLS